MSDPKQAAWFAFGKLCSSQEDSQTIHEGFQAFSQALGEESLETPAGDTDRLARDLTGPSDIYQARVGTETGSRSSFWTRQSVILMFIAVTGIVCSLIFHHIKADTFMNPNLIHKSDHTTYGQSPGYSTHLLFKGIQLTSVPPLEELDRWGEVAGLANVSVPILWKTAFRSTTTMSEQLTQDLAHALKRYSHAYGGRTEAKSILVTETTFVNEHVKVTIAQLSKLFEIFLSIQSACGQRQLNATRAVNAARLSHDQLETVRTMPAILLLFGKSPRDKWLEPLEEKKREMVEAEVAVVTVAETLKRLEDLQLLAKEISRSLEQLRHDLLVKEPSSGRNANAHWGKDWFWQHFGQDLVGDGQPLTKSQFDAWWINLPF